jgi:predicted Ser/Thr protein kinase
MSELRSGDHVAGFVIERELGRGGMGAVFLARDERLGRQVALKVIVGSLAADPGFRARFEREARIAATLEHPHVVPVYDIGDSDGRLFIAMRFIAGHDLAAQLREYGAVAPRRLAGLLAQVCAALDAAHRAGLVHRDVKPANVLLTGAGPDEHAYLSDFGLTREAASDSALTGTGEWIGTIDYAAPEQIEVRRIDARTDVYAAACMAFHALTGHVPFAGGMAAKLHGHLSVDPPSATALAPALPDAIDDVLACGMAKDPEHRFASAGDLARELSAVVTGQPNTEPPRTVATGRALTGIPIVADENAATAAAPVEPRVARAAHDSDSHRGVRLGAPFPSGAYPRRRRCCRRAAAGGRRRGCDRAHERRRGRRSVAGDRRRCWDDHSGARADRDRRTNGERSHVHESRRAGSPAADVAFGVLGRVAPAEHLQPVHATLRVLHRRPAVRAGLEDRRRDRAESWAAPHHGHRPERRDHLDRRDAGGAAGLQCVEGVGSIGHHARRWHP